MRYIIESGEVLRPAGSRGGFVVADSDLVELQDGRSWNPQFTVWQDGEYPGDGAIVRVEAKNYYEKTGEYATPTGMKQRREKTLSDVLSVTILGTPKPQAPAEAPVQAPTVDEGLPF